MYIEPNTTIKLYSGIPWDSTYTDTVFFPNITEQTFYFHEGRAKYTLSNNSYQRVERGKMRIEKKADDLYDCNYLAFQNVNFGNKWFYAFITGVEYVNNVTSEVTFEIDTMQTYMFDVHVRQCFVERTHTTTDEIGEHIQPEPVELGEYIISDYERIMDLSSMAVIVGITDTNLSIGDLYDGIFGGLSLTAFRATDTVSIRNLINNYTANPEQVVTIYTCPKWCIVGDATIPSGGQRIDYGSTGQKTNITLDNLSQETNDFGGYVPFNKKLYTYPYNFVRIDNASGDSLNLRYEFFANLTPVLEITSCITQPVQVIARPCYYKGLGDDSLGHPTSSKTECITLNHYPLCSWSNEAYKQWVSQKVIPLIMSSVGRIAGGAAVGGLVGGAIGAGSALLNAMSQSYEASIKADTCRGAISDSSVNIANGYQNFYKCRCHISKDYAQVIDQFFTRYGYAVNRLMTPIKHARPHWTYVKTRGCCIDGSAPADEINKMCRIYDNGITFWAHASEVGDYTYDNRPT